MIPNYRQHYVMAKRAADAADKINFKSMNLIECRSLVTYISIRFIFHIFTNKRTDVLVKIKKYKMLREHHSLSLVQTDLHNLQ